MMAAFGAAAQGWPDPMPEMAHEAQLTHFWAILTKIGIFLAHVLAHMPTNTKTHQ
jgi:hypothetical protein